MRRRIAIELVVVVALFAIAGYVWLHPASRDLVAGDASRMIGDGTDSITNVWQYQILVDTWVRSPWRLLFGAIYTDQATYPDGYGLFIPYSERVIVLLLSLVMRVELMPTAVVWVYVVLSGVAMHVCGRLLGWPRTIAFALALAWAISPHTRARSETHIALVGVYFAPLAVAAIRILAGSPRALEWSPRRDLAVAAALLFAAAAAAHYYLMLLVGFAPVFVVLYVLLLPSGTSMRRAAARLGLAALPALVLVVSTGVAPLPPADAAAAARGAPPAAVVREANDNSLRIYGAHVGDFFAGDVRFGDRDLNALRSVITRAIREDVPVNRHERTNGIRWTVLAAFAALAAMLLSKRRRATLRDDERRLGWFALILGAAAFAIAIGPSGLRHHDVDLGPARLLARVLPAFRVANRAGVLVHFAALIGAGIVASGVASRVKIPWQARAVGPALLGLVVLEYLPLHPVITAPVAIRRDALEPPAGDAAGTCGAGITVPYVTFGFQADHYYWTMAELRGTSCKLLHPIYLTAEDDALRAKLSTRAFSDEDLARAVSFTRCTRASWAIFRLEAPDAYKQSFCTQLDWSFVAPDACRGAPAEPDEPKHVRECIP